jgi:hypothetical protein
MWMGVLMVALAILGVGAAVVSLTKRMNRFGELRALEESRPRELPEAGSEDRVE